MKRKKNLKDETVTKIDSALLTRILGSVEAAPGQTGASATVIRQEPFSSFFHS